MPNPSHRLYPRHQNQEPISITSDFDENSPNQLSPRHLNQEPISIDFDASIDSSGFIPESLGSSTNPMALSQSEAIFPEITDLIADLLAVTESLIGRDNRIAMTESTYPWRTIGRLYWSSGSKFNLNQAEGYCTATLVRKDLILTNSHCLRLGRKMLTRNTYKSSPKKIFFVANMVEGIYTPNSVAMVTTISQYGWETRTDEPLSYDWALLKLDKPLGDTHGYLGWRDLDFTKAEVLRATGSKINLTGYSNDFPSADQRSNFGLQGKEGQTAGVHMNCNINRNVGEGRDRLLLHDCDSMGGASGSALIALFDDGIYYIVGLHRGSEAAGGENVPRSPEWQETCIDPVDNRPLSVCRNIALPVSAWSREVARMLEN